MSDMVKDWLAECTDGRVSKQTQQVLVAFANWQADRIAAMQADAAPVAWIVGNGNGDRWRAWKDGNPVWVEDREKATRYARREDAEAVHEDDEDAWRVVLYTPVDDRVSTSSPVDDRAAPNTSGKLRDAVEVYQQAYVTWVSDQHKDNAAAYTAAAAVIEADREAVRAYWYRQGKDDGWQCREEQAAELAEWREKYDGLANDALKKIGEMGARIGRLDVELDAAKADLQAANRELAKFKALAETLAGALEGMQSYGCPVCNGDCGSANPPVIFCPMTQCAEALRQYKEARDAS